MQIALLDPTAASAVVDVARSGIRQAPALRPFLKQFGRLIDYSALTLSIDECQRRFDNALPGQRVESDAWLAPRVHAAVRLDRTEAANDGIWAFLAAYAFPDYVRWRWGENVNRFTSTDIKKQAFKRLWWGAEFFRNSSSYSTVGEALSLSDVANTYLSVRNLYNRGVALAFIRYIKEHDIGSRQANPLSTQLKTLSVTVALDRAWPARDDAAIVDQKWLSDRADEHEILRFPIGPDDVEISQEHLDAVFEALGAVIDLELIRGYRRAPSRVPEPAEVV